MGRRGPHTNGRLSRENDPLVVRLARRHFLVSPLASDRSHLQRLGGARERQLHRRRPSRRRTSRRPRHAGRAPARQLPRADGSVRQAEIQGFRRLRGLRAPGSARPSDPCRPYVPFHSRHRLRLRDAFAVLARRHRPSRSDGDDPRAGCARAAQEEHHCPTSPVACTSIASRKWAISPTFCRRSTSASRSTIRSDRCVSPRPTIS